METKFKKGDRYKVIKYLEHLYDEGDVLVVSYCTPDVVVFELGKYNIALTFEKAERDLQYIGRPSSNMDKPTEIPPTRRASDMTIREHYAGLALQGMLAADDKSLVYDLLAKTNKSIYYCYAKLATEQADALIQALNDKP